MPSSTLLNTVLFIWAELSPTDDVLIKRSSARFAWWIVAFISTSSQADENRRVWIDTDTACGSGLFRDVDDCLALHMLLDNPDIELIGISTIFGNAPLGAVNSVARRVVRSRCVEIPIYVGASLPNQGDTPASIAIREALQGGPLTVLLLGPATNLAQALRHLPTEPHDHQVIAVAGTRFREPGFRVGTRWPFRLRDLNFDVDSEAASTPQRNLSVCCGSFLLVLFSKLARQLSR